MNYRTARKIRNVLLGLAIIALILRPYGIVEGTDALDIALPIIAGVLIVCTFAVILIFFRCPHCRYLLPSRSKKGSYCPKCEKDL